MILAQGSQTLILRPEIEVIHHLRWLTLVSLVEATGMVELDVDALRPNTALPAL